MVQPAYWKSWAGPGASITPSSEMNSETMILRILFSRPKSSRGFGPRTGQDGLGRQRGGRFFSYEACRGGAYWRVLGMEQRGRNALHPALLQQGRGRLVLEQGGRRRFDGPPVQGSG